MSLIAMVTWAAVVIFSGKHVKNEFKKINNGEPGKGKSVDKRGNRYYDTFDLRYYDTFAVRADFMRYFLLLRIFNKNKCITTKYMDPPFCKYTPYLLWPGQATTRPSKHKIPRAK